MWFFRAPESYFGEDALDQLNELTMQRVFIVTDENLVQLGHVQRVQDALPTADSHIFAEVEPDPSVKTIKRGANLMHEVGPDWIIGLGGGSCMDAAKAMWILYERPDLEPEEISPFETLNLRQKAHLICIPTTAGTGSEASHGIVLTDTEEQRKLTLGSREVTPDIAIVDPVFTAHLPQQITADSGIDALTHAVEAFSCNWANDFSDGLALQAARMVFDYLPRAVKNGADDEEAREKMANAAAIAGMTLGNSQVALAHAFGHSAGAVFHQIPHGRITAIFLPYTIQFVANGGVGRYGDLAMILGLPHEDEASAARQLAAAVCQLMQNIGQPTNLREVGISKDALDTNLSLLCDHVEMDANTLMSRRYPERDEIEQIFRYAFDGREVDF
ncbi:MAG: iron-containing alcohol dehydrogenase [Chloroflexi bacterium]|nr:iron-containing alcohol dehydrogenase [Chloroflexota bacterium]